MDEDVLKAEIAGLRRDLADFRDREFMPAYHRIEAHLDELNGKVAENTRFRYVAYGALLTLSILASTGIIIALVNRLDIIGGG